MSGRETVRAFRQAGGLALQDILVDTAVDELVYRRGESAEVEVSYRVESLHDDFCHSNQKC